MTVAAAEAAEPAPNAGALAALHRLCFDDEPWGADVFTYLLALPSSMALAERQEGEVVGFVLCRLAADEGEVLTCAVHPACRRQGIALYERCGFRAVGRRRQYYVRSPTGNVDAIVMRRDL